jgi:hypothetical protein
MEIVNKVFQTDSEKVNRIYKEEPNYLIEYNKTADSKAPYCILYFSSHDIYYPNTEEAFKDSIVKKNKFEWYQTRVQKGEKHIFLRDIKKQWYLTGINKDIDSLDRLAAFLNKETEGYKVITVGSSAGGFAAVFFGQLLEAELIFTFNGQFYLNHLLTDSSPNIDPIIFREKNNLAIKKYFDLRPFIKSPKEIYYFHSTKSDLDKLQFDHVSDLDIKFISFKTSHHGIPFLKSSLNHVINSSPEHLQDFVLNLQHPFIFSSKIEGIPQTIISLFLQVKSNLKIKLKRIIGVR